MSAGPGWYPDAVGVCRWWDGARWTDRTEGDGHLAWTAPGQTRQWSGPAPAEPPPLPPEVVTFTPRPVEPLHVPNPSPAELAERRAQDTSRAWLAVRIAIAAAVLLVVAGAILVPYVFRQVAEPSLPRADTAWDAVRGYNDAYLTGSCADFQAATTRGFRTGNDLRTCEEFTDDVAAFERAGAPRMEIVGTDDPVTGDAVRMTVDMPRPIGGDGPAKVVLVVVRHQGGWAVDGYLPSDVG